jgi:hypothetical protein
MRNSIKNGWICEGEDENGAECGIMNPPDAEFCGECNFSNSRMNYNVYLYKGRWALAKEHCKEHGKALSTIYNRAEKKKKLYHYK